MHASTTDGANSAATSSTPDGVQHFLDRVGDRRVVEVGDHVHVGAKVANQQHRLERAQVGQLGAHHGGGTGDARLVQGIAQVSAARQMRDSPAAHDAHEPLVLLVIEHHHPRAREMQLLDRAQPDRVQPAHDHMTDPVPAVL